MAAKRRQDRSEAVTSEPTHLERLLNLAEQTETAMADLVKLVGFQSTKAVVDGGRRSLIVSGGPYWRPLNMDGLRAQAKAIELYEKFDDLVGFALQASVPALIERFRDNRSVLSGLVNQLDPTYSEIGQRMLDFAPALREQVAILTQAAFREAENLVVPDTNVVLAVPELQQLAAGQLRVTVVLVPTVLRELDSLKVSSRPSSVRSKAIAAVRRLKEMRRRGDILKGVTLEGTVRLRALPLEPKTSELVSWLDPSNMDDRLLASAMSVARRNLAGRTSLVTSDVNLQNKAAFAELPCFEPPATP